MVYCLSLVLRKSGPSYSTETGSRVSIHCVGGPEDSHNALYKDDDKRRYSESVLSGYSEPESDSDDSDEDITSEDGSEEVGEDRDDSRMNESIDHNEEKHDLGNSDSGEEIESRHGNIDNLEMVRLRPY